MLRARMYPENGARQIGVLKRQLRLVQIGLGLIHSREGRIEFGLRLIEIGLGQAL